MLLQQHGKGASYVVALPPSASAHMRSPPALPRQGPAPASAAPWPPRGRAAGARLRRASSGLEAVAGARQRAAPGLAALLEDGGEGGTGGALLGGNAPLESLYSIRPGEHGEYNRSRALL